MYVITLHRNSDCECSQTDRVSVRTCDFHGYIYLRSFIENGLRQTPDMESREQFTNLNHDPITGPNVSLSYKIMLLYSTLIMIESISDSIKLS